jgi:hypothetical protein
VIVCKDISSLELALAVQDDTIVPPGKSLRRAVSHGSATERGFGLLPSCDGMTLDMYYTSSRL